MGFYDAFKDALSVAQKADNIELYRQLLDLSNQALELQNENSRLQNENDELKKEKALEEDIVFHKTEQVDVLHNEYPYITRKSDLSEIRYCGVCWGYEHKLVPLLDNLNCQICLNRRKK